MRHGGSGISARSSGGIYQVYAIFCAYLVKWRAGYFFSFVALVVVLDTKLIFVFKNFIAVLPGWGI